MGLSACDAKVTFELAGASMRWVHPKELLHPQIGAQEALRGWLLCSKLQKGAGGCLVGRKATGHEK